MKASLTNPARWIVNTRVALDDTMGAAKGGVTFRARNLRHERSSHFRNPIAMLASFYTKTR